MLNTKKTKIICTIGPSTNNEEMILALAERGMNICRLNFSHGDHAGHLENINLIKNVREKSGHVLGIMADTKGPEIRCGDMENGIVEFKTGDFVQVVREEVLGNKNRFSILVPELFDDVSVNDYLLIDDGKIRLTIIDKPQDGVLKCRVENFGVVKTRKGVNVPNVKLSMPFVSKKDEADIRFACQNGCDFIAASFVRRAQDVNEIRAILLEENRPEMQIIAKIENQEGYENIDEILEAADGIMVARGDLGVEVSTQLVPIYQKTMISKANAYGKPVITATHMLESMMGNPRPTRAEASDVANAILDGSDAIMTSGETAAGAYPLETIETMNTIATAIEPIIMYEDNLLKAKKSSKRTIQDTIGLSVSEMSIQLSDVKAIIAFTQSGSTARRISKFRPQVPILAVTFTPEIQRSLQAHWGVIPILSQVQNNMHNDDELASKIGKEYGLKQGDYVIVTAGYPTGEGTTNMLKVVEIK